MVPSPHHPFLRYELLAFPVYGVELHSQVAVESLRSVVNGRPVRVLDNGIYRHPRLDELGTLSRVDGRAGSLQRSGKGPWLARSTPTRNGRAGCALPDARSATR